MPAKTEISALTPEQAGIRLGCSGKHVYRLIEAGELRAVDIAMPGSSRSKTRVRSDDVDAYIKAHTRTTGSGGEAA